MDNKQSNMIEPGVGYVPSPVDVSGIELTDFEKQFARVFAESIHADWYYNRLMDLCMDPEVIVRSDEYMKMYPDSEREDAIMDAAVEVGMERSPLMRSFNELTEIEQKASIMQAEETVKLLKSKGIDVQEILDSVEPSRVADFCYTDERDRVVDIVAEIAHELWARDKKAIGRVFVDTVKLVSDWDFQYESLKRPGIEELSPEDRNILKFMAGLDESVVYNSEGSPEVDDRLNFISVQLGDASDAKDNWMEFRKTHPRVPDLQSLKEVNVTEEHPAFRAEGTVYTVYPEDLEKGIVPPGTDLYVMPDGKMAIKTFNQAREVPEEGLVLVKKDDCTNTYDVFNRKQFGLLFDMTEDGTAKRKQVKTDMKPGLWPKNTQGVKKIY